MTTSATTTDRVTPHSLEAEQAVLGALLVEGDRILEATEVLGPTDFYRVAHQLIFRVMREMAEAHEHIDPLTVGERLRQRKQLDEAGGPAYLWTLTDGMPRGFNLAASMQIIREHALRARLIRVASTLQAQAYELDADPRALIDKAEAMIFALAQQDERGDFIDAQQLVAEGWKAVEQLVEQKRGITGIPTGFVDFDEMTRGLQPGALILVAARPSMGKSAFALNIAHYAAAHGLVVGVFSLEMSRQEVFVRLVSAVGGVDGHRLQSGYVSERDYGHLTYAFGRIGESSLFVDDTAAVGILDVRGKARRLKARHGLHLLVLDYLQLLQLPKAENRNVAVAEASRALKLIARELSVPVVALSQLSRATEQRVGDHKPLMSDLRDSGALEQDADLIVFIHRPEVYAKRGETDLEGVAEIIIAKQRNGPTGMVKLRWSKEFTRFDNWTERN
jgi:replicative DNA helicase